MFLFVILIFHLLCEKKNYKPNRKTQILKTAIYEIENNTLKQRLQYNLYIALPLNYKNI